jgi:hypothetical protein
MKDQKHLKTINLINHIEIISRKSARSSLNPEKLENISNEINALADFLEITPTQAVLFACIAELSLITRTNIEALSRHFKSSPLKIIGKIDEIDALIYRGLIRKNIRSRNEESTFNDIYFKVPNSILEGIHQKDQQKLTREVKFDIPRFLEKIFKLSVEREEDLISTRQFVADSEELIRNNRNLEFVKYVDKQLTETINKSVVFLLAYVHLTGRAELELSELAEGIFDDISDQFSFQQYLRTGNNELITKEFVVIQHSEFRGDKIIQLTGKVISRLFQGHQEIQLQDYNSSILIRPDKIKSRPLFFNANLQADLNTVHRTLMNRNFNSIKRELRQRKFSTGLTILRYGHSGTGKTEVVYQFARKTNREIMMVDLSQARSKWFGETEKNVKKIFDDYRLVLRNARMAPILFINEADGLLSKRLNIGPQTTSTVNAMNIMQNVLLQEMEAFDGILFATTNLTGNLDKAFDRRFLFKLNFTHPEAEIRQKIWKSRLPELSPKQTRLLSEKFELTGGQIENTLRYALLAQMVDTKLDLFEALNKFSQHESGYGEQYKIGF